VLKNVGLTADLQARLDDLRASRQRLVAAQDDARRRLERNLHDGAQQRLVAIKVKLGLVEMLLTRDPEKASATIVAPVEIWLAASVRQEGERCAMTGPDN
jgi:signal transduction histidine kinase